MEVNFFQDMKKVNQKTRDIVYSFVKQVQSVLPNQDNPYYNIPPLVFMLATIYYFNPEYFTSHGDCMKLSGNNDTIQSIGDKCGTTSINTVYGNIIIRREDTGKFIWTFKIIQPPNEVILIIGIDSSKKECINTKFTNSSRFDYTFYGYYSYYDADYDDYRTGARLISSKEANKQNWKSDVYGPVYTDKESEVVMELNMNDKSLKYHVNGEDQGVAFDNICFRNDEQYTMCISLDEIMSVKLVDFQYSQ